MSCLFIPRGVVPAVKREIMHAQLPCWLPPSNLSSQSVDKTFQLSTLWGGEGSSLSDLKSSHVSLDMPNEERSRVRKERRKEIMKETQRLRCNGDPNFRDPPSENSYKFTSRTAFFSFRPSLPHILELERL